MSVGILIQNKGGRDRLLLKIISMHDSYVTGVDIGGSHITAAIVDIRKQEVLAHTRQRKAVRSNGTTEEILSTWCEVIEDVSKLGGVQPDRMGMAMPGPFDYEKGISLMKNQDKYDALYGLNIKELLSDRLSLRPANISIVNDAACFLQGEVFGGAAKDSRCVAGITLGTGFGAAYYMREKAEDAEWWCLPFGDSIADDYFSTRWFIRRYRQVAHQEVKNVKELLGRLPDDPSVHGIMNEFGTNLGAFLAPLLESGKTELLVIGGNIAHGYTYFKDALERRLSAQGLSVVTAKASLGENAALAGAASLVEMNCTQRI